MIEVEDRPVSTGLAQQDRSIKPGVVTSKSDFRSRGSAVSLDGKRPALDEICAHH